MTTLLDMETHPDVLAERLRERAAELSLTQREIHERTQKDDPKGEGVSVRTVAAIMGGERGQPHPSTLRLIDRAINWPEGTCKALLEGREPPDGEKLNRTASRRLDDLEAQVEELSQALRDVVAMLDAGGRLSRFRQNGD